MKTCPPEVFWRPYHTHKPITRKNPLHFQDLVKKWRFLTNFFTSTKIFTCLVNKCWPKFFHDKKALIFLYTTLASNFSHLLWSLKYFVLKIKYTRIRFSNNYLQMKTFIPKIAEIGTSSSGTDHVSIKPKPDSINAWW